MNTTTKTYRAAIVGTGRIGSTYDDEVANREEPSFYRGELRHAAMILGSIAFAALMLDRLGYRLTMLALAAFLVGAVERRPALPTALVALGLSFGTHFVFWTLLRVPLPAGPFGL